MTPEGKVKNRVKALLDRVPNLYYEMWVPSGYGKSGLDFNGCVRGHAFYIETKKANKDLRPRQRDAARRMYLSGATVFIISGEDGVRSLYFWLHRVTGIH